LRKKRKKKGTGTQSQRSKWGKKKELLPTPSKAKENWGLHASRKTFTERGPSISDGEKEEVDAHLLARGELTSIGGGGFISLLKKKRKRRKKEKELTASLFVREEKMFSSGAQLA